MLSVGLSLRDKARRERLPQKTIMGLYWLLILRNKAYKQQYKSNNTERFSKKGVWPTRDEALSWRRGSGYRKRISANKEFVVL